MEKVGQLLLSYNGHPEKASNQKKRIFSDYYDKLFNSKDKLEEDVISLTKEYFKIEGMYKETEYQKYEQKIFYIIFINRYLNNYDDAINLLEKALLEFRSEEHVPQSRKLIQIKFKELIVQKIKHASKFEELQIIRL